MKVSLKQFRKDHRLTQAELAEKIGVTRITITRAEQDAKLSFDLAKKLFAVFDKEAFSIIGVYEAFEKNKEDIANKKKITAKEPIEIFCLLLEKRNKINKYLDDIQSLVINLNNILSKSGFYKDKDIGAESFINFELLTADITPNDIPNEYSYLDEGYDGQFDNYISELDIFDI